MGKLNTMEYWSNGVLEYWVLNALLQYSNTPVLQFSIFYSQGTVRQRLHQSLQRTVNPYDS